ncbi:MAG: SWIM zinc finger domain-containing protein [Aureispira sp.]
MQWTDDKISLLAPNASTERRGRMLANSSRWTSLSTNYEAIWGECKGSGAQPYQVHINLKGPKFKCSCPVRQLPCKHGLGLLLLYANSSALFKYQAPPTEIANWLSKHYNNNTTSNTTTYSPTSKSQEAIEKAEKAKEKRWQQRLVLMESGILELEQWLQDMVRQGIANTDAQKATFWNAAAAKMVDAKLPSIGVFLKETQQIMNQQQDWSELVVARLGTLYSWVEAFKKRAQLPTALQHALFERLGKTTTKAAVVAEGRLQQDDWLVLGSFEDVDVEGRDFRRLWLHGWNSGQHALLLDYAFGSASYEQQYLVGNVWRGQLAYYSPAYAQRATWVHAEPLSNFSAVKPLPSNSFEQALTAYSQALSQNPWLQHFPILLEDIRALWSPQEELLLVDQVGQQIPLDRDTISSVSTQWKILALSGGHPITLMGEWDGHQFRPLSSLDSFGLPNAL